MIKIPIASALALLFSISISAQSYTVSGFLEDASSGERLIGANVYDSATFNGTSANLYGFYSLTLPPGEVTIIASYVGFQKGVLKLNLQSDTSINFKLKSSLELSEFEVTAEKVEKIQERSQMSSIDLPMKAIEKIPPLLGERDVLKAIQLLPGVQSGSEGSSGLYVRGGGPDQNLILLDGVPVYNASHLFGFFSVFNSDAINSVELIKGGFPAHYGGRLSSVIDIRMKEGHATEFHGSGSIGLVSSKLTLEGPIVKDKVSFVVSGRRTYIDFLARPLIRQSFRSQGDDGVAGYYFYDLNGKVNWKISDKDRLYLSTYTGDDRFYFQLNQNSPGITDETEAELQWGNITTALRYNRVISKKLFMNVTGTYSRYDFLVGQSFLSVSNPPNPDFDEDLSSEYQSGIYDWAGRVDFDYIPSPNHYIKFGVSETYHTFIPGVNVFDASLGGNENIDTTFGAKPVYAHEFYAYIEDDIKIGSRLKMNLGLHYSGFIPSGVEYFSLQPRVSGRFLLTDNLALKASYAEMQQFIHLLTNATIGLPTDLWVPSTEKVKPQNSKQVALGLAQTFRDEYEISIEGYYKDMRNLIEYSEGASFFTSQGDWEDQIEVGRGWSYGAELFIQKKVGKMTGWLGYTLSWTQRQFDELNFGNTFPYRYDRRHDISIVWAYDVSDRFDIAATWVYGTGNAVSIPTERYRSNSFLFTNEVEHIDERNGYRLASYHRLDFGANFHKQKKHWKRTWSIGAYNVYSRKNPFFLFFDEEADGGRVVKQVSLFPIIPYVSYSFEF